MSWSVPLGVHVQYPRLGITVLDQLSEKLFILLQSNYYLLENKLKKNVMYLCQVRYISECIRYICLLRISCHYLLDS